MDYNDLIQAVYTETARPDLVAETQQAVLSSTLKMHLRGRYLKDIQPGKVVFDFCSYIQELDTQALPFYRNMVYMRRTSSQSLQTNGLYPASNNGQPQVPPLWGWWYGKGIPLFTLIEADDIFDVMDCDKTDIMYQAGSQLNIRSSVPFQFAQIAYLRYPNIDITNNAVNFNSWIATELPYCIVYDAAASVFATIGQNDTAATYNSVNPANPGKVVTWMNLLDMNNTVG